MMGPGSPTFVGIDGNIGSGKTEFARRLARQLNWQCVTEDIGRNPFLTDFYGAPEEYAFETEIAFVLVHRDQLRKASIAVPPGGGFVADFCLQKDPLFADITLGEEGRRVFEQVYRFAEKDTPVPDLLVYLRGPPQALLDRIGQRGRPMELGISEPYLEALNAQYEEMLCSWPEDSKMVFEINELDWHKHKGALEAAVEDVISSVLRLKDSDQS